jgi:hypothetical protein
MQAKALPCSLSKILPIAENRALAGKDTENVPCQSKFELGIARFLNLDLALPVQLPYGSSASVGYRSPTACRICR